MTDLERRIQGKIPGADTGIEVRQEVCDICAPGPHCGVDCYVRDGKIIKVEGTKNHPVNHGLLCPRGQANRQYVYRENRIQTPLRRVGPRGSGRFEPIGWEEALDEAAGRMLGYKRESGPESVAFFSGYNKWYRPFLQRLTYAFGSPNYGTESSCCFTASIMAWKLLTGAEKCSPDIAHCGLYLAWAYSGYYSAYLSAQPTLNAHQRGMKIIVIDHRYTHMAERSADLFLQIRPGTDAALAFCFANLLIQRDWIDREFIRDRVHGYETYKAYVSRFTPEYTQQLTGVPAEKILRAVDMMHQYGPVAINENGAALLHHRNGMQTYRAIMSLTALMGTFDRPGGNIPTYMTYAHSMAGFETGEPAFSAELRPALRPVGAERYPIWYDTVHQMQAMDLPRQIREGRPYPIKMLWAHGLDYRMWPDSPGMLRALETVDFFVDVDLFMTDSARYADIVLPACSGFERGEFRVFGGRHAAYTRPVIAPLYESRPDTDILFDLARRLELKDELITSDYDTCLGYMLRHNPSIDLARLKEEPYPVRVDEPVHVPGTWRFQTPTGKFEIYSERIARFSGQGFSPIPTWREPLAGDGDRYPFTMCSGIRRPNVLHSRLHDMPWLQSLFPEPYAEINREDGRRLGIQTGDTVEIFTGQNTISMRAVLTDFTMPGTILTYHGHREADVNSLMGQSDCDPYSGFPAFKSYRCGLRKRGAE
ncbi:MAG: molybdopterin-dependent oxidoreductase [Oscillospiraceae bacterium]|nr:molybdopterin-dependent oxidoreductase [Oscillospiraceae bacterium]